MASLGNLTQKIDNGTADNYTANALNQYTYINSQALTYDAKGNLLQRAGWAYTWDAHNRLRSAAPGTPQAGNTRLTFAYDGRNRCAARRNYTWTDGAWELTSTLFLTYSDWNLIEERDAEGTLAAAYVHGPVVDDLLARITPTGTLYYHADAQHNTVAVTDSQAIVLERYTYDIFGLPTVHDAVTYATFSGTTVGNRFLFQGREWLAGVKLNDHRNRLYSPEMHRWLSRDPVFEKGGFNLYRFVDNGPLMFVDPSGESLCSTGCVIGGVVALGLLIAAGGPFVAATIAAGGWIGVGVGGVLGAGIGALCAWVCGDMAPPPPPPCPAPTALGSPATPFGTPIL